MATLEKVTKKEEEEDDELPDDVRAVSVPYSEFRNQTTFSFIHLKIHIKSDSNLGEFHFLLLHICFTFC